MRTKILVVAVSLGFALTNVHAATNTWTYAEDSFWDDGSSWLLGVPDISQEGAFITNASSKTVTLDAFTVSFSPSTLTISNLVVAGTGNDSNTLFLSSAGLSTPLRILKGFSVGNLGGLQVTNSFLRVDGMSGGQFAVDGAARFNNGLLITTNAPTVVGTSASGSLSIVGGTWRGGAVTVGGGTLAFSGGSNTLSTLSLTNTSVLQFALGTNSTTVQVSGDLTLGGTLNITDRGGFSNTTYTLFTYAGELTDHGLVIGTTPNGAACAISVATAGQVNLVVSNTGAPPQPIQITAIARQGNDIKITWNTSGASNIVQVSAGAGSSGSYSNNFVDLSSIIVTTPTTNYVDVGGATNSPSRFYRIKQTQ